MKKKLIQFKKLVGFAGVLLMAASVVLTSCKKDKEEVKKEEKKPEEKEVVVKGEITSNTTWSASKKYTLEGFVYVTNGATLTIEPGTIIKGDKATKGTLIVERGGKIMAEGTAEKPIVFTSNAPAGYRNYGDWGGLILCGKASINVTGGEAQIEGGPRTMYGGASSPDDNDNSGSLKYVRIEFAGIPFQPDKEVNGLTLGGVGKGTTIEYIQVSYCGDDSYEWFGGNVNAKYLIAYKGWDDDFDTDYGFSGKVQFCIALRDKAIADPGSSSNSFESDNDGSGSSNTPFTKPIFSNVSLFGPYQANNTSGVNANYKNAFHLRRNTKLCIYNSIVSGFAKGLQIDGTAAQANATNNELQIANTIMAGMPNAGAFFVTGFDTIFLARGNNDTLHKASSLKITDPYAASPNFLPMSGSPALSGAAFTNTNLSDPFFTQVTFKGAMGTTDWTQGWTNWDPQNTAY